MIDVLEQTAVPNNLTGTTVKTPLGDCLLPAQILGLNGQLLINFAFQHNLSVGNKTLSIEIGGVEVYTRTETNASATMSYTIRVKAKNSFATHQISATSEFIQNGGESGNNDVTLDLTRDRNIVFFGTLAAGGDNIQLDSFSVQYMRTGP